MTTDKPRPWTAARGADRSEETERWLRGTGEKRYLDSLRCLACTHTADSHFEWDDGHTTCHCDCAGYNNPLYPD
jgi:hypothetical protein